MKTYSTVTELNFQGIPSEPSIFRDYGNTLDYFDELRENNKADVIHLDDFCQIAENAERTYKIVIHSQVEINK